MKWISVKDRLPDTDELVLVWDKDWYNFARYDHKEKVWKDITSYLRHVKYWAVLPEPPV